MALDVTSLGPGDVIAGRYQIEDLIGRGGFGLVFRAVQLPMGRRVALKVVQPRGRSNPTHIKRFFREAEIVQRLRHPNTVVLHDFGQTDEGIPYIAWEYLDGRPLDLAIEQDGPFPTERVVRVATQVAKSLMEAHAQGFVHRDIKPQNVMLCDFAGEPDFIKVLDFGVAGVFDPDRHSLQRLTSDGQLLGTPYYTAPEVVLCQPITPAVDIYALGLMMCELLTGNVVYFAERKVDVYFKHISEDPVPIPDVVRASPLGPIIDRATRKKASERTASAAALLEELRQLDSASLRPGASPLRESSDHLDLHRLRIETAPTLAAVAPDPSSASALERVTAPVGRVATPLPFIDSEDPVIRRTFKEDFTTDAIDVGLNAPPASPAPPAAAEPAPPAPLASPIPGRAEKTVVELDVQTLRSGVWRPDPAHQPIPGPAPPPFEPPPALTPTPHDATPPRRRWLPWLIGLGVLLLVFFGCVGAAFIAIDRFNLLDRVARPRNPELESSGAYPLPDDEDDDRPSTERNEDNDDDFGLAVPRLTDPEGSLSKLTPTTIERRLEKAGLRYARSTEVHTDAYNAWTWNVHHNPDFPDAVSMTRYKNPLSANFTVSAYQDSDSVVMRYDGATLISVNITDDEARPRLERLLNIVCGGKAKGPGKTP